MDDVLPPSFIQRIDGPPNSPQAELKHKCELHLGAKHRRRARLRMPLQAPFMAYQVRLWLCCVLLGRVAWMCCLACMGAPGQKQGTAICDDSLPTPRPLSPHDTHRPAAGAWASAP